MMLALFLGVNDTRVIKLFKFAIKVFDEALNDFDPLDNFVLEDAHTIIYGLIILSWVETFFIV